MNYSQPSEQGRRGSRARLLLAASLPAAALAAILALTPLGCRDDITPPHLGTVEVGLSSSTANGYAGSQIYVDSVLVVDNAERAGYTYRLEPGEHRVRLEKDCADVEPAAEAIVRVEAGRTASTSFFVRPEGAIEVTASMAGAEIWLDGAPTGEVTPMTFSCMAPGPHEVSVRLFGATAGVDSVRTVEVAEEPVSVDFTLTPRAQDRGVLVELFTATLCPNCPVADAAVESLWTDTELVDRGYVGLQVHNRWGGSDPFYYSTGTQFRTDRYDTESGIPRAFFSGIASRTVTGVGSDPDVSAVMRTYSRNITEIMDGAEGPADFALYWLEANREPGVRVTGRLRVMVVNDIADPDSTNIYVVDYKDDLETYVAGQGTQTFYKVARIFQSLGDIESLGLTRAGDWRDFDVELPIDYTYGSRHETDWAEAGMGLVAFVQKWKKDEWEVDQVARTDLP